MTTGRTAFSLGSALVVCGAIVTGGTAASFASAPPGACDDNDPVKVGVSVPLTGPIASYGDTFVPAIELAIEQANTGTIPAYPGSSGILGRCLELIVKDDAGDPTQAAQVVRQLVYENEVDFVVGPSSSSTVGGSLDIVNNEGVIQFVPAGLDAAGDDPETYPYTFVPAVTINRLAPTWVDYLQELGSERPALLVINFQLGLESRDAIINNDLFEVAAVEVVEPGTTDMTAAMQRLQDADPDAMLVLATGADLIAALHAREALRMTDLPAISFIGTATQGVLDAVGEAGLENVYAGQAIKSCTRTGEDGPPRGELCAAFHAALKEFVGEDPLTLNLANASLAYDATIPMIIAANEANSLDPDDVKAWLEANPVEAIVGTLQFSPESHLGVLPEYLTMVLAASQSDGVLTASS